MGLGFDLGIWIFKAPLVRNSAPNLRTTELEYQIQKDKTGTRRTTTNYDEVVRSLQKVFHASLGSSVLILQVVERELGGGSYKLHAYFGLVKWWC